MLRVRKVHQEQQHTPQSVQYPNTLQASAFSRLLRCCRICLRRDEAWRVFGYWGALGSVLLFLMYFPYTKHVHLFMAPVKHAVAREVSVGGVGWLWM